MEALYLLIPLSVAIVGLAAWIFLRMSDSGQFDDMDGPAHSILLDDDRPADGRPADGGRNSGGRNGGGRNGGEAGPAPRRSTSRDT